MSRKVKEGIERALDTAASKAAQSRQEVKSRGEAVNPQQEES